MARKTRDKTEQAGSATAMIVGICLFGYALLRSGDLSGMSLAGMVLIGVGGIGVGKAFFSSRRLPKKEVMRLAEEREGILTLSEITTELDIEPSRARRTLLALSKDGIAVQRWEEFRKNLWEFPDYMKLPITESIELAKSKGGRLTMEDMLKSGHSAETARQTFETLSEKGLAQRDPSGGTAAVIVTTQ